MSDITKHTGDLIAWFAPEGPLRDTVLVIYSVCVALVLVAYRYYLGLLAQGAEKDGSIERQDYEKLRASLAGGNLAARLYEKWLTKFLDRIERFFGDAGMADRTLFPRAFGLQKPAPLWTAPAFDRCLLLALIYPIATIFLIWAISGHIGPAEYALGLKPEVPGWSRSLAAAAIGFSSFAFWRAVRARGWKSRVWIAVAFTGVFAGFFAGAGVAAFAVARAVGVTFGDAIAGAVASGVIVGVGLGVVFAYLYATGGGGGVDATVCATVFAIVGAAAIVAPRRRCRFPLSLELALVLALSLSLLLSPSLSLSLMHLKLHLWLSISLPGTLPL